MATQKEEVLMFGKPSSSDTKAQQSHQRGIQVLRKGPANADGSHSVTQIGGASGKGGVSVQSVGADGVYRDADGNVALDTGEDKEMLHLKRRRFCFKKRLIFEWSQTLEDVTLFLRPPKHAKGKHFDIVMSTEHLRVGLKGMR